MVIVSHDRELLGLVDQIADLPGGGIRVYGGNLAAYERLLAAEQAATEISGDPRPPPTSAGNTADSAAIQPGVLVEFIVRGPERIALVGPNGAGKTTGSHR